MADKKAKILVVDDEPKICEIFSEFLERLGYEPLTASNGEEALGLVNEHEVGVIITDEAMPKVTGPALLSALRQQGKTMPVILMGGHVEKRPELEGLDFFRILQKPVNLSVLKRVIERALAGQSGQ